MRLQGIVAGIVLAMLNSVAHATVEDRSYYGRPFMSERALDIVDYAVRQRMEELYNSGWDPSSVTDRFGKIFINGAAFISLESYARDYAIDKSDADSKYLKQMFIISGYTDGVKFATTAAGEVFHEGSSRHQGMYIRAESSGSPVLVSGSMDENLLEWARYHDKKGKLAILECFGNGVKSGYPAMDMCRPFEIAVIKAAHRIRRDSRYSTIDVASMQAFSKNMPYRPRELNLFRLKSEYFASRSDACKIGAMGKCVDEIMALSESDPLFTEWLENELRKTGNSLNNIRQR